MDYQNKKKEKIILSKSFKKKKMFFLFIALFTFSVNVFAWFVFTTNTGITVDANVVSWNVRFLDGSTEVHDALVSVAGLKPGMSEYTKSFTVQNLGGVSADFSYEINSLTILGRTVDFTNISDRVDYLENFYPFSIEFTNTKNTIPTLDYTTFTIHINWLYEDATLYYALNNVYDYDNSFLYYKLISNEYTLFTVNSVNYEAQRSELFLEKDDADSYFGMRCKAYETSTGNACLRLGLTLTVTQTNS